MSNSAPIDSHVCCVGVGVGVGSAVDVNYTNLKNSRVSQPRCPQVSLTATAASMFLASTNTKHNRRLLFVKGSSSSYWCNVVVVVVVVVAKRRRKVKTNDDDDTTTAAETIISQNVGMRRQRISITNWKTKKSITTGYTSGILFSASQHKLI